MSKQAGNNAKKTVNSSAAGKATTVSSAAGKIAWDASRPLVRDAIAQGVAQATTVAAKGIVEQLRVTWLACRREQVSPDHADKLLAAIGRGIVDRKRANGNKAATFTAPSGARVAEFRTIMSLYSWNCSTALVKVLDTIETITMEDLYTIAVWMRGPRGKGGNWKSDIDRAPTRETLITVTRKVKVRDTKNTKRPRTKADVVGMPKSDPKRGAQHVKRCIVAWGKANPEASSAAQSLLAGMMKSIDVLINDEAPRIVKIRAAKAAE